MNNKPETTTPDGGIQVAGNHDKIHVGGDWVQGDKVNGDKIVATVSDSRNVAIGKDIRLNVSSGLSAHELTALFAPILQAVTSIDASQRPAAEQLVQDLQAETAKGEAANDSRLGKLIDGLTGLVPTAVSAVVATFTSPILAAVVGPVTKFVLEKIQGK